MTNPTDTAPDDEDRGADVPRCYCQLDGVMGLLGRKYAMQVVCVVEALGPVRFGTIESTFDGVSSSTLSARLHELTDAGLLEREQFDTIPPRVEYTLTSDGEALAERLAPVLRWAERREAGTAL